MSKKKYVLNTVFGPYSSVIRTKDLFFISGQIPVNKKTGIIPKYISDQTTLALQNINLILHENYLSIQNIVKITIFTTQMDKLKEINLSYQKFFNKYTNQYPARSCIGISELPQKVSIEIEAIASVLYKK
ncbi:Rid family detoxifying hydrolase [Buchnera aphidicola]|uniref:2-iminobutanoate/2-iminopropanoate deaminase n=1 Tax=Buchnera aphidicola (Cinara cf. splendens/pseudotsugae 3390) TaxID=2518980 RepID=A0A451CWX2_9GAMM|nr:Rid family detoxifying hydrolase [Buchnera aphidicola]VFP77813.1 2-iminobutanoate/2-iminopropanoate deaminase [Buchnera aphidicola (Cinara cf. splendens/pseudotsugae 3390)]